MALDIALVFAAATLRRGTRIKHFMVPPHSLQILAALTPPGHRVRIIDEYHGLCSPQITADLVGISVWTASSNRAYTLADHLLSRGITVVLGGPHVSAFPDEAQAHATTVVVGEAESVWADVVADAEAGALRNRYHGLNLGLERTPDADWSVVDPSDYAILSAVSTSRGCVRSCDFCYESSRPKPNYRRRPIDMVLRELDARPSPVIAFLDNDLLSDRPFARHLLGELRQRKVSWLGMTTIAMAEDEAFLDLVAGSGCRSLFIGFESVSPESLKEVHKGFNRVETYVRNVRRIHDRGIMVNGSFVFGFDHDGPDVFDRTVAFGREACLDTATFTVLTPYPGTTLYQRMEQAGRIVDRDWSHYDTTRVVYRPVRMSAVDLEAGYFRAYREFYSWGSILQRCRPREAGFAQRLFLNVAYKRVEPFYGLLGQIPVGVLRPLFHWYARPFHSSVMQPARLLEFGQSDAE